jgi:hypothetical protein
MSEITQSQQAGSGGGVVAEGEDTQVVALPFRQAMDMIIQGEIRDGKTIIALQYLALRKAMESLIEAS